MLNQANAVALIPCKDLQTTRRFYEDVLGFSVSREAPSGIDFVSGESRFSLYPSQHGGAAEHTVMGWSVDDVESTADELIGKGITFENYDFPGLKTNEKGIAEMGGEKGAWFKDPEGNILALFEESQPR